MFARRCLQLLQRTRKQDRSFYKILILIPEKETRKCLYTFFTTLSVILKMRK
jgi:hypothetical protein